jgi:hypothetical protein
MAAQTPGVLCSVTHSSYLADAELAELVHLGCALEHDMFTAAFPIEGRPAHDLAGALVHALDIGALAYLTSDAGQVAVGDPFDFSAGALSALERATSENLVYQVGIANPAQIVAHLDQTWVAA